MTDPRADAVNVYLATIDRMEPEITAVDLTAAAASIAISLKRIADALERTPVNSELLAVAIEGAIYRGLGQRK